MGASATGAVCAKAAVWLPTFAKASAGKKPEAAVKQLAAMTAAPQSAMERVVPGGFVNSRTPLPTV